MWVIAEQNVTPPLYLKASGGFFSWTPNLSDALRFDNKGSADAIGEIIVEATQSVQA